MLGFVVFLCHHLWLICSLTYTLVFSFHGSCYRWLVFVILLLPALLHYFVRYCFFCNCVKQIAYGPNPRNLLDIFLPEPSTGKPVVVFLAGGAWIIGYKAWNLFTAPQLNHAGIIVVSPDYRNFPQGHASDMVQDGSAALAWVKAHIADYGGDPGNITLVGQSAGAWMAAMMLVERAAASEEEASAEWGWDLCDIKQLVGISGPYDVADQVQLTHFHNRGLYRNVMYSIFEGELSRWSPTRRIQAIPHLDGKKLPPVLLMHGTADQTVPFRATTDFGAALRAVGASRVEHRLFEGKTHTDGIIEDVLSGENAMLSELVGAIVHVIPEAAIAGGASPSRVRQPSSKGSASCKPYSSLTTYYPKALVKLARGVNPF